MANQTSRASMNVTSKTEVSTALNPNAIPVTNQPQFETKSAPQAVTNGGAVSGTFVAPATQNASDVAWNERQAAFDRKNQAGTQMENVQHYLTQDEINAAKGSQTFNASTSAAPAPETVSAQAVKKTANVGWTQPSVDFNTSAGREAEIQKNLSEGYANAPELFKSQDAYRKAYGYETADQGKKAILDAFYSKVSAPQTPETYLQTLFTGGEVAPVDSSAKQAISRYNNVKSYAAMDSGTLAHAYNGGKLDAFALKDLEKYAPDKYKSMITMSTLNGGKTPEANLAVEQATSDSLTKAFANLFDKKGESSVYQEITSNPDVKNALDAKNQAARELNDLNAKLKAIDSEVDNELRGTGATSSYAQALKSQRQKDIMRSVDAAQAKYNSALAESSEMMKYALMDVERNDKIDSEKRAFAQNVMLKQFDQQMALDTAQKEFELKLKQNAQLANDPTSATNAMLDSYEKMGILPNRSRNEILADVQSQVDAGKPLGQALSELNQAFRSKPEFQRAQEIKAGALSDREKMQYQTQIENARIAQQQSYDWKKMLAGAQIDMQKLATQYDFQDKKDQQSAYMDLLKSGVDSDTAMAAIRTYTGDWKGATGTQLLSATDGTVIPSRLSQTTNPNGGKECAEYVNDVIGAREFGDSFASKMAQCNVRTGVVGNLKQTDKSIPSSVGVGSVAVWQPGNSPAWQKYGHVGIIVADNGDTWSIKSSNLYWQGEISTKKVPKDDIWGYKTNAVKLGGSNETITPKMRDAIVKQKAALDSTDQAKTWRSAQGVAQWLESQGNKPLSGSEVQGLISNYAKILDPTSVVRESEYAMAQAGAGQGFIDKKTQEIRTFLEGGSQTLSADAQKTLKQAIARRIDAMRQAYLVEAQGQVETANASGIPLKLEQLVPKAYSNVTKNEANSVSNPNDVDAIMAAFYNR